MNLRRWAMIGAAAVVFAAGLFFAVRADRKPKLTSMARANPRPTDDELIEAAQAAPPCSPQ